MEREKRYLAYKQYNPSRVIRFGTTMHNCLTYNVLKSRNWQETQVDDWDIFYADTGWIHENLPYSGFASGGLRLNEWQKVSKIHTRTHTQKKKKKRKEKKRKEHELNSLLLCYYYFLFLGESFPQSRGAYSEGLDGKESEAHEEKP